MSLGRTAMKKGGSLGSLGIPWNDEAPGGTPVRRRARQSCGSLAADTPSFPKKVTTKKAGADVLEAGADVAARADVEHQDRPKQADSAPKPKKATPKKGPSASKGTEDFKVAARNSALSAMGGVKVINRHRSQLRPKSCAPIACPHQ